MKRIRKVNHCPQSFVSADEEGNLEEIAIDDVKNKAAAFVAQKMHEANLTLETTIFSRVSMIRIPWSIKVFAALPIFFNLLLKKN